MAVGEVVRAVEPEVGAVGAEVVVDDVEEDGEAEGVSPVHEPAQVVGRSRSSGRGRRGRHRRSPSCAARESPRAA